jgi:ATP-dependent Zn protease
MDILSEHRDQLETLAQELIVKETLIDADICSMFGFEPRKSQEKRGE